MSDAGDLIQYVMRAEAGRAQELEPGKRYLIVDPNGRTEAVDTFDLAENPARPKGTVVVHDTDGMVNLVNQLIGEDEQNDWRIYDDVESLKLVVILNDDVLGVAGWRDWRVDMSLRDTPEWTHWKKNQGLLSLTDFADAIEEGLPEIRNPSASDMLELAQTFQASTQSRYKQGNQLRDGRRQFVFEEDIDAKAGTAGTVSIPETFTLELSPFYGSVPQTIEARLKYRLREGKLQIGYQIVRPHEVEANAFGEIRDAVTARLNAVSIAGVAPGPDRRAR